MKDKVEQLPGFYMDFDHNELEDDEIEEFEMMNRKIKQIKKGKKKQSNLTIEKEKGNQYKKALEMIKGNLNQVK